MSIERSKLGLVIRWSLAFFFLSGMTGLIYQVLWTRRLTLTFGHTVLAVSTVLTAFMAGLALGSLLAGRWADKHLAAHQDPVRFLAFYGYLEAFVGLWALLSLPLLGLVEAAYLALSTSGVTGLNLYLACFAGSLLVLVPPTTAMGATVPVMSRLLVHEPGDIGRLLSRLYGINTLGAFTGAGLAGFLLLPWLGLKASMLSAAVINLGIGISAVWLVRSENLKLQPVDSADVPESEAVPALPKPFPIWLVPLAFGMAGVASMAYQVGWTRGLSLSIGSSVYAFSAILVTFLAGLGLGSIIYPKVMGERRPELAHLGLLQLGIGALGAATIPALGALPYAFFTLFPLVQESFARVLVLDVVLSGVLLFGPTLLMGLAFPLATHLYTATMEKLGRSVGEVYSANTFGCILGAFLAGFVLIPHFGAQWTLKLATLCYLLVGVVLLLTSQRRALAGVSVALCLATVLLPNWSPGVMAGGVAVYSDRHQGMSLEQLKRSMFRPPAFYKDGLSCTVSINFYGPTYDEMAMRVNGKVDASLGKADKQTMYLTGYLPALLHKNPQSVAVVGLGSGLTLEALAQVPEVESIECAELEPAVVEAGRYWKGYNGHVLDDPRVTMHVTDGRTFILGSPRQYDIIASEPSNPWIAGIGNLFTRDFYETCSRRLAPGGIMCQWFNLYSVSEQDLAMVLHSFFDAFPHGMAWQSAPGDLLLIGSNDPVTVDPERVEQVWDNSSVVRRHFYEIGLYRPEMLLGHYLFSREKALEASAGAPFNTDDRPLLEFSAPQSLYRQNQIVRNLAFLRSLHESALPPGIEANPTRLSMAGYGWINTGDTPAVRHLLENLQAGRWEALLAPLADLLENKQDEAAKAFARTLESYPDFALAAALAGDLALRQDRAEHAVALYRTALQEPPPGSRSFLLHHLGQALVRTESYEQAAEAFRAATEEDPRDSMSPTELGYTLLTLKQPEEAVRAFDTALERNPTDPFAFSGRGQALYQTGQVEPAAESLRKALELVPDDIPTMLNLGICYLRQEDAAMATRTFRRILEIAPDNAPAREMLGRLQG